MKVKSRNGGRERERETQAKAERRGRSGRRAGEK